MREHSTARMDNQLHDIERLEASLWEAADQLRANSKLTSSEYCMPVLGIIFLRHATTSYLYQATTTDAFVRNLENLARGAAYPAVVAHDFEESEIVVPPAPLVSAFNDFRRTVALPV